MKKDSNRNNQESLGMALIRAPHFYIIVLLCVALFVASYFYSQAKSEESNISAERERVIELLVSGKLDIDVNARAILPAEYPDASTDGKIYICRVENSNRALLFSEGEGFNSVIGGQQHIIFFVYRTTSISDARAYAYITDKFNEYTYRYIDWDHIYIGTRVAKYLGNGWFDIVVEIYEAP